MDLVIFTIGATERWLNSGVAQEALPQDGSHGKHRNTQVKAVVWQGTGVWGRLHTLVMLQRKRFGHRKQRISQEAVEKQDRTLSSQRWQRCPSPQGDLGAGDSRDAWGLDQ